MKLNLNDIRMDNDTQSREYINNDAVDEYVEELKRGVVFPPVTVFYDGKEYWLADGYHRCGAHSLSKIWEIDVDIKQGGRRDAILFSVGANVAHGIPRTNVDKRRSVKLLLKDPEWGQWGDREIARRCAVAHTFVANLRKELRPEFHSGYEEPRVVKRVRNGREHNLTLDPKNLGGYKPVKGEAIKAVLATPAAATMTNVEIAAQVGASPQLVDQTRKSLGLEAPKPTPKTPPEVPTEPPPVPVVEETECENTSSDVDDTAALDIPSTNLDVASIANTIIMQLHNYGDDDIVRILAAINKWAKDNGL